MKDFPQILAQSVLRPGGVIIIGLTEPMRFDEQDRMREALAKLFPEARGAMIVHSAVPCLFIINVETPE